MARNIDYAKVKAMLQSALECIGDEPEGENPKLPKQDDAINDGGQDELYKTAPDGEEGEANSDEPRNDGKKKKIAMMGAMLANKFKK